MIRHTSHRVLACTLLIAAFCLSAGPAHPDEETSYTCYAKFTCTNGMTMTTYRVSGTSQTQSAAMSLARTNANTLRMSCITFGHSVTPVVDDGCDPPTMIVRPAAPPREVAPTRASADIMLVHHCATKGGHQLNLVVYGPRQALEALSDSAWNQLAVAAADDGGLVPGSGRTRVEDMYVHFVYQTVRSTSPANKIHREFAVQGRGATEDEASKAATEATEKVKAHLSYIGETPVEVGPKRHVPVIQGEHGIVIEECVYRATTVGNWTVIATDFGTSKPEACAAARAVANTIANNYGGAASGTEIEPHEQP